MAVRCAGDGYIDLSPLPPRCGSVGAPIRDGLMSPAPVVVGSRGGTIHQLQASRGELFQVCFNGRCLYCDSLHVGLAHLSRMERQPRPPAVHPLGGSRAA
jgi:hypothetical protein